MASFAHALKSFSDGSLSQDELIAEVERILEDGRGDETWLLETLAEEHARLPLPAAVHEAVKRRIEASAENKRQGMQAKATVGGDFVDPDVSRTRLATQFFASSGQPQTLAGDAPALAPRSGLYDVSSLPAIEAVKGVGDVLNERFVLEERVGSGGMSTVYKALSRRPQPLCRGQGPQCRIPCPPPVTDCVAARSEEIAESRPPQYRPGL
jgi:hypothetical protein